MTKDLDTLATALHARIDDELKASPWLAPWRPKVGITPTLSDAEPLTLAVMPALLRYTSERRWLRRADRDFCRLFPYVPGRSGYGKRLRAASFLLTSMIRILARDTSLRGDDVWLVDSNGPVSDLGSDEGPEYLWSHENSNGTFLLDTDRSSVLPSRAPPPNQAIWLPGNIAVLLLYAVRTADRLPANAISPAFSGIPQVSGPPAGGLSSECRVFRNHDETHVGTSVDGVAALGPNVGKTDGFQCARPPAGPRGLGSRGAGQLKGVDQRRAGDEPGRVVHLFQVQLNSFPEIDQGRHRPRRRVHRLLVARADSAFYSAAFTGAVRRAGAFFPVTVRIDPKVRAAIAAIPRGARTPIRYPRAIWDDQPGGWISDAEAAETGYTAFASKKGQAITARLIVRRVRDLTPGAARGQGELFPAWRYHAIFADSPFATLQAEEQHRGHALAEQVFADLTSGPLAHLPSGSFPANAAWLACAAISHNLLRAAGTLASPACAKARGATLRRYLISVAARTARHGRGRITCTCPKPGTARPSG